MTGALNRLYHISPVTLGVRNSGGGDWGQIADEIAETIYNGQDATISKGLYDATAGRLIDSLLSQFEVAAGYDSPRNSMRDYMQNNIFAFSAAKSLTEFQEFGRLLTDENGKVKSRAQFRRDVERLGAVYNDHYLNVERETAVAQSQMAEKWQDFEENRGVAGQWEYRTAGDGDVRPEHARLDGMIIDMDDPASDTLFPPLDYGCRCTGVQLYAPGRTTPARQVAAGIRGAKISPHFKHNPGKSGIIFQNQHPYFRQIPHELKAVDQYGMKEPGRIYSDRNREKMPGTLYGVDTPAEFAAYWRDLCLNNGNLDKDEFSLNSPALNDLKITFDKSFFEKYVQNETFKLFHNVPDALAAPDEVWTAYTKQIPNGNNELITTYIKYYAENPVIFTTKTTKRDGIIQAIGFDQVDITELDEIRQGILRFRQ